MEVVINLQLILSCIHCYATIVFIGSFDFPKAHQVQFRNWKLIKCYASQRSADSFRLKYTTTKAKVLRTTAALPLAFKHTPLSPQVQERGLISHLLEGGEQVIYPNLHCLSGMGSRTDSKCSPKYTDPYSTHSYP